jgi:hypothetical protein
MSFKEDVNDAILHVVAIRVLIQQSRPPRPGEKYDEEKEKKKVEKIEESKKNLKEFSSERIGSLTLLSQQSMPMDIDEVVHKLERMEFLLEDVSKGKDRKSNLKTIIETLKSAPSLQSALLAIPSLTKITSDIPLV